MRHVYANRATYILATMLVVAVLLFGWLRSRAVVIEMEDGAVAPPAAVVTTHTGRDQGAGRYA